MHSYFRLFIFYSVLISTLIGACIFYKFDTAPACNAQVPCILCSTSIIHDVVQTIAGDKLCVEVLMHEGVDPHLYKPTTQDIAKIDHAKIIFYNGLHLEARMADIFENMQYKTCTIAVSKDIDSKDLIQSADNKNYYDPHIWFDTNLWNSAISTITKTLCNNYPEHTDYFLMQAQNLQKNISLLHQENKKALSYIPKKQRFIITGHDAFSYFARAYDFKVVSLQGISTESEAGTHDLINLAKFIHEHHIPSIFVESSVSPKNIHALQEAVNDIGGCVHIGRELFSDALGCPGTLPDSYIGMMRHNVQALVAGLAIK